MGWKQRPGEGVVLMRRNTANREDKEIQSDDSNNEKITVVQT